MKYNLKLNLNSILKYELLTNNNFNHFDSNNVEEVQQLIYCMILANNDVNLTYEGFLNLLDNNKIAKEIVNEFTLINQVDAQFNKKEKSDNIDKEETNSESTFSDVITTLIMKAHLPTDFVLNDLKIYEIETYLNAYDKQFKQEMEEKRLFTYLSILPHIDGKKINSPEKIYQFYWETKNERDYQKEIKENTEKLNEFLQQDWGKILNNTKTEEQINE
jgi:hypothetical protein